MTKQIAVALVLLAGLGMAASACQIKIQAGGEAVFGAPVVLTVDVIQEHSNCVTPIEATKFTLSGLDVVSYTAWKKVSTTSYRMTLTVSPTWVGEVGIEVRRDCIKYGPQVKELYFEAALGLDTVQKTLPTATKLVPLGGSVYQVSDRDGKDLGRVHIVEGTSPTLDFQLLVAVGSSRRVRGLLFLTPNDVPPQTLGDFLARFSGMSLAELHQAPAMTGYEALSQAIVDALQRLFS
ncbi:MAG: hypothetical protein ABID40_06220 [Candidatus Bipolaricaulota bacterium]